MAILGMVYYWFTNIAPKTNAKSSVLHMVLQFKWSCWIILEYPHRLLCWVPQHCAPRKGLNAFTSVKLSLSRRSQRTCPKLHGVGTTSVPLITWFYINNDNNNIQGFYISIIWMCYHILSIIITLWLTKEFMEKQNTHRIYKSFNTCLEDWIDLL